MKKFFYGLSLQIFIIGLILLAVVLLLDIPNLSIPWSLVERTDTIDYVVYAAISFVLLVTSSTSIARLNTYGIVLLFCLALSTFFIFWFPLYKEDISTIIQWATPSAATFLFLIVFSFIVYKKSKFLKLEKKINSLIKSSYKTYRSYSMLSDAKQQDKSNINLIDGVERKDEMLFYDIDFSIIEHDK